MPYHHGALREALLKAGEALLEQGGVPALTLRAVAREARVSHAAPAHHFGDLSGLLTALAARGFAKLGEAVSGAMARAGADPAARLTAMGRAYVGFARCHPGLFVLMSRGGRLDLENPDLYAAMAETSRLLRAATEARAPASGRREGVAFVAAVWSLVHGFSLLLIDGRLKSLLAAMPGGDPDALLKAVLEVSHFVPRG
ncbi:MAG: TetR/AcrR family transcriptional regulator [Acetobacteraceae bacterium]|nr:TetR/AcrR family transcriptional regulator [Acetobacteraceae bacterium]